LVLDVDDRNHGGRQGSKSAVGRLPVPTALVESGGGLQVVYVLREAFVLDRDDPEALAAAVRAYLQAALALQALSGADATAWPSHLYRCPSTYHLKDPTRPFLVGATVNRERRFHLSDFDDFASVVDPRVIEQNTTRLVSRLTGRSGCLGSLASLDPVGGRVVLPRRVSPAIVRLLNEGRHRLYCHRDGTLDRSRAVYAAALSLLAAGLSKRRTASVLAKSALRAAVEDRGDDGLRWLTFQVDAAAQYLADEKQTPQALGAASVQAERR
jgi:hypothetical protein